jgi:gliding motility-associated-like protein
MKNFIYIFLIVLKLCGAIPVYAFHHGNGVPNVTQSLIEKRTIQFEENKKQLPAQVKFSAPLFRGGKVYFEDNGFTYHFWDAEAIAELHHPDHDHPHVNANRMQEQHIRFFAYKAEFIGAQPHPLITGSQKENFYRNYFLGNDSSNWSAEVAVFNRIRYQSLYQGIDVEVYNTGNNMEYDYIVAPGADASQIQVRYHGVPSVSLIEGNVVVSTGLGTNTETKPVAYQIINGIKKNITCTYRLIDQQTVAFNFPDGYNQSMQLIIDPVLICSGYSGSTADNWAYTATYDAGGNIFSGGIVTAIGYPTTAGAYQTTFAGGGTGGYNYPFDICITKYNPTGSNMIYSTYLGGNNNELPSSIYADANDNLFVLGKTYSLNFPVTANAYDNSINGGSDLVVCKFNATGTALLASTFMGGSGDDGVNITADVVSVGSLKYNYADDSRGAIFIDNAGDCYVSSCTKSINFPVTAGAFQTGFQGGAQDGCVFKLTNNLNTLLWSTYLGGAQDDAAYYLDVNSNQQVYVTGGTSSSNFPITPNAYHTTYGGQIDGFLCRLSADGTSMLQSTYIGTSQYDQSYFVQLDADGDVYICGQTRGSYVASLGVYNNPNSGQFIHKFSPDLSTTIYQTVFGSGTPIPNISPTAFLVDECENIYVSGWGGQCIPYGNTGTTNGLPVTPNAIKSTTDGCDFYFFVLKKDALSLWYASYYGGNAGTQEHVDGGTSRFDKKGVVYQSVCAGCGGQDNFPTTPGVYSSTNNSNNCNIAIIKIDFQLLDLDAEVTAAPTDTVCSNYPISFNNNSTGATYFIWDFGDGSPLSNIPNPSHIYNSSGIYTVTLIAIDSTSCNFADTSILDITVIIEPISGLMEDTVICGPANIPLNAGNAGFTYSWNTGETTPVIIAGNPGTYSVNISNGYCTVSDTTNILLVSLPPVGNDTAVCKNDPIVLNAGNPGCDYLWNTGATTQTIEVPYSGTYWVMVTAGNCVKIDSVNITYLPLPAFTLGGDTIICPGDSILLSSANNAVSYLWSNGTTDQYNMVNESGIYWAEAYSGQCSYKDSIKIEYYHQPNLGVDTVLCSNTLFKLDLSFADPGGTYLWNTGATTSFLNVYQPGVYSVILTYNETCHMFDTIVVNPLDDDPPLFIPNSFTPNGDGLNEVFNPVGNNDNIIEFYFAVYNRWGELIFETRDRNKGWDGTMNNQSVQMGVYVYKIDYSSYCSPDKTINKFGHIVLLR